MADALDYFVTEPADILAQGLRTGEAPNSHHHSGLHNQISRSCTKFLTPDGPRLGAGPNLELCSATSCHVPCIKDRSHCIKHFLQVSL